MLSALAAQDICTMVSKIATMSAMRNGPGHESRADVGTNIHVLAVLVSLDVLLF